MHTTPTPNPVLMELMNSEPAASIDVCVKRLSGRWKCGMHGGSALLLSSVAFAKCCCALAAGLDPPVPSGWLL